MPHRECWGCMSPSLVHDGRLIVPVSGGSCAGSHCHCEFMSGPSLSRDSSLVIWPCFLGVYKDCWSLPGLPLVVCVSRLSTAHKSISYILLQRLPTTFPIKSGITASNVTVYVCGVGLRLLNEFFPLFQYRFYLEIPISVSTPFINFSTPHSHPHPGLALWLFNGLLITSNFSAFLLDLLRLVFRSWACYTLESIYFLNSLKSVYSVVIGWSAIGLSVRVNWFIGLFRSPISLLVFLSVFTVIESMLLTAPRTLTVLWLLPFILSILLYMS